ncbi:unnamed protein product [Effrenium voratum]|uniref:Uncharacterized protein n=1 Tax=Effrenium voratum TaxID=2562239 RepID=A0AA36IKA1_9DINO|nr:unnamed protein product [Effrenium voratum]
MMAPMMAQAVAETSHGLGVALEPFVFVEEIHRLFVTHLQCWQHIASLCERRKWRLFKIVPKHHYFQEMAQDLKRNLVNPNRAHACWYDESFLGYIKKIATACHSSSMIQSRFWQRYLLLLAMRFEDARRCSR